MRGLRNYIILLHIMFSELFVHEMEGSHHSAQAGCVYGLPVGLKAVLCG